MTELRYPNETHEYRNARNALLAEEQALIAKVKAVAEMRRKLPSRRQAQAGLRLHRGQ